jgi:hypothetical protein
MRTTIVALIFALSASWALSGTANAEIQCSKAVSKEACLAINDATPKPKQDKASWQTAGCCYSCSACGASVVQGQCTVCAVH